MKIIGTTKDGYNRGFIIQASEDEVARVMGYAYASSMPNESRKLLDTGSDVDVNGMYEACISVSDSAGAINETIKTHKRLIQNLEKFSSVIAPASEIIKSKRPKS